MEMIRPLRESREVSLRVEVVPAYDFVISLAAAAQPQRYETAPWWARTVRHALPAAVRRDLAFFFGDPAVLGTNLIQLVPGLVKQDADSLVAAVRDMDSSDAVVSLLVRRSAGKGLNAAVRRMTRARAGAMAEDERLVGEYLGSLRAATRARFWEMVHDPAGTHSRLVALLQAHLDGSFAEQYATVEAVLLQRARQGRRSVGKLPAKEVIARLTGGFTLQSADARSVTLVPSYFAYPFVFYLTETKAAVVIYGARPATGTSRDGVDSDSVRVLKALADETRLRILQLLVDRPLYGQQIAEALGVSHPTVSHHMSQLRVAGLARTEVTEDGAKRYFVRPETVERLCADLQSALVVPSSGAVVQP